MKSIREVYDRIKTVGQKTIAVGGGGSEVLKGIGGVQRDSPLGIVRRQQEDRDIMGSLGMDHRNYEVHDARMHPMPYGKLDICFFWQSRNPYEGLLIRAHS